MEISKLMPSSMRPEMKSEILMWNAMMQDHIEFSSFGSEIHTKAHCGRVLMFAELIADALDLSDPGRDSLAMASIFHDSRRLEDGPDIGHGKRAAEYYKYFCNSGKGFLPLPFSPDAYLAMAFHDQKDEIGDAHILESFNTVSEVHCLYNKPSEEALLIYHIFKDADALDRFRLGIEDGLNTNFLRTEPAVELLDFAKDTVVKALDGNAPHNMAELIRRLRTQK